MMLSLNAEDIQMTVAAVSSIVSVGSRKEETFKVNSTNYKVLDVNRKILEKLNYANNLLTKPDHIGTLVNLELNRVESKVLIAGLLTTTNVQDRVMQDYGKREDNDPAFADEEGRRKADYVGRLRDRMDKLTIVLEKIRRAL